MTKGKPLSQISKSAMAEFLSQKEWTHWVTLTTRSNLSLASARRAMIRFVNILKSKGISIQCFFASEPFDSKVGYHIHALINAKTENIELNVFYEIIFSWRQAIREFDARVTNSPYNPKLNATGYTSKYIQKNLSDYDYLTDFNNDKIGDGIEQWQIERKENKQKQHREKLLKIYKDLNYSVEDIKKLEWDVFENFYEKNKSQREITEIEKEIYGY